MNRDRRANRTPSGAGFGSLTSSPVTITAKCLARWPWRRSTSTWGRDPEVTTASWATPPDNYLITAPTEFPHSGTHP